MWARLVLLGTAAAVAALAGGGGARPAPEPGASGQAWAIRVVVPNGDGAGTVVASAPPAGGRAETEGFAYPAEGLIVSSGRTSAAASTKEGETASAAAAATVQGLVLFGGEITAETVTARASAAAGPSGTEGGFDGTEVTGLQVFGEEPAGDRVPLGDWGVLTVRTEAVDTGAPRGARGRRGYVTALDVRLTAPHGGLPAGSEIRVGYAEVAVQTPPAEEKPEPLPEAPGRPLPQKPPEAGGGGPAALPIPLPLPSTLQPPLEGGPYVFPVFGEAAYTNTYTDPRPDVEYHHGADIFGELGRPVVACASGTVFSVGWNRLGGLRLWLRDEAGNEFYYAHLSAYSTLATNGARVKAGQVLGFMGTTGDAGGTQAHLHFEIHPVSLLYLGYDGAVDPNAYLDRWKRLERLPPPLTTAWAPSIPGRVSAPQPGAVLLAASDISSADGLDPASLRRAIRALPARP